MRNKGLSAIILCFCVMFALTGCQLAKEDGGVESGGDKLIGVLVTTEHLDLFTMDSYLNDHPLAASGAAITFGGSANAYQRRLYASLVTDTKTNEDGSTSDNQKYVFDGIDGIAYFAAEYPGTGNKDGFIGTGSSEGISDGNTALGYGDSEDTLALNGTVYVNPFVVGVAYANPVYQSRDGVYVVSAASGFSFGNISDEGEVFSQKFDETSTITEDGKTRTNRTTVEISFATMLPPEQIVVLQMDKNGMLLTKEDYEPGKLPKSITPNHDAAYIIVETYKHDAERKLVVSRSLCNETDKSMETYYSRDDGICIKQNTQLIWK